MAESDESISLSALTEGQDHQTSKTTCHTVKTAQTTRASSQNSLNSKKLSYSPNKRGIKVITQHNLRSGKAQSKTDVTLKRFQCIIEHTENSYLKSSPKRRRLNSFDKYSTLAEKPYKPLLIIDCVAHRTRSKTLLHQEHPKDIGNTSKAKETLSNSSTISNINCPGSNTPASNSTQKNLLNYYRKKRNLTRNLTTKSEDNTKGLILPSIQIQNYSNTTPAENNIVEDRKNIPTDSLASTLVGNLDSKKKFKLTPQTKNSKYKKLLPPSTKIARKNNENPSNKAAQISKALSIEDIQSAQSSGVASDAANNFLMAQQFSGTSNNSGKGQLTSGSSNSASTVSATSTNPPNATNADSESDDSEVGRLQALLESRGLPPHLFGALGPRMTHILHRTIGNSSSSKAQQLLQGLQSHDESQQLQAAIEMCQMLVMGNEDTLAGFPVKQVVPSLITLLRMEHNFDIMNNACRALAYMLEALPRSSGTVVEAVPAFLEKLQVIQCMDVAEQSLTALDILSRRHNKAILQAGGVAACLMYLDFFSINAQRAALSITANCCLNLHSEEFVFISESLPLLARLLSQQDKKCVECVCTAFCRLVESFQQDNNHLQEIASMDLLRNCQQLLILTPSILNSGTFTNVIRMLSLMSSHSSDLAIVLLKNNIASTLLYLLTGSAEPISRNDVEMVPRSPSELFEITCLIEELMPRLPTDDIFSVDALLERPQLNKDDQIQWQWRDDRGIWHSYSPIDSRMIEASHLSSDDDINLNVLSRTYTIDFHSMQQINDDTGTTRPIQRRVNSNFLSSLTSCLPLSGQDLSTSATTSSKIDELSVTEPRTSADARIDCLKKDHGLASEFIRNLFNVLYEVYSSSAGPNVRYKCLRALLRMVYYASSDLLKNILKKQLVSSHIAGMMASKDLRIVVGALQMAEILMRKLPDIFGTHFKREGVLHQINQLADPNSSICRSSPEKSASGTHNSLRSLFGQRDNHFCMENNNTASSTSKLSIYEQNNVSHSLRNFKSSSPTKIGLSLPSSSSLTPSQQMLILPNSNAVENAVSVATPEHNLNHHFGNALYVKPKTSQTSSQHNNGNICVHSTTTSNATNPNHSPQQHNPTNFQIERPEEMFSTTAIPTPCISTDEIHSNCSPVSASAGVGLAIQSKMSDILKRKVPPKRRSQLTNRSKSKQDETISQQLYRANGIRNSGSNTPSSNSTNTRSRFGSNIAANSSTKPSFLASLNPARWGRQGPQNNLISKDPTDINGIVSSVDSSNMNANLVAANNREKAWQWVRDQSSSFVKRYCGQEFSNSIQSGISILTRLSEVITKLNGSSIQCVKALQELKQILMESDISPFEVNHSGLIKSMLNFMTCEEGVVRRDDRLRAFLHVFAGLPLEQATSVGVMPNIEPLAFSAFVAKLNGCVTQLEQFPVKVHDFPTGASARANTSVLKFFNTHQLKCNLQRHPDCNNLRQWKGGTVKIDPLAMVQAIERYLVVRGYGGIRGESDDDSEEDVEDNVASIAMSQNTFKHKLQFLIGDKILPYAMTVYQAVKEHSPLVNDQSETETDSEIPLANASIWVQQHTIYYRPLDEESFEKGGCSSTTNKTTTATIPSLSRKTSSKTSKSRVRSDFYQEGAIATIVSPLKQFLTKTLPTEVVSVQDASSDALCMLRVLHALNRHWESLYGCVVRQKIISHNEFIHSKITAKANRQLQDPLVIMTGNIPQWLQQIPMACPFLFPFETRHLLFYAVSFDRDRALQRLLDTTPDLNAAETSERVAPRLDRRKRLISREEILKQAEHIMQDFGHSKALLEIQYENEVGTGLGPTLEFYALISAELQRCELGLWNGGDSYQTKLSVVPADEGKEDGDESIKEDVGKTQNIVLNATASNGVIRDPATSNIINSRTYVDKSEEGIFTVSPVGVPKYVNTSYGLFPMPLGKSSKIGHVSKIKTKFKFLGKFMAKAVMDSRMIDLPFSMPFYRWLLNEQSSIGLADLHQVVPEVQNTLVRLLDIVDQRDKIKTDTTMGVLKQNEKIELLDLDGCLIADLGLDFVLPGYANIELCRGGRDIPVTIHNLHQYVSLVTHWFLIEGVQKQFEALREGFESVFPCHRLKIFYPEELENVFCGSVSSNFQNWDVKMLKECCRTDHGFTQNSEAIHFLFEILSSYNSDEQRLFLQFVTGSPRLPTGGFKSLTPPLTIVRKTLDVNQNPNDYLPSVMTCVNYLKLPEYTSCEVMRQKLKVASNEGSRSFHLS